MTQDQIILEMLSKGELQVGDKERNAQLAQLNTEVISIVASKCVDPKSKRVYPPTMIEKALSELRENPKFHAGGGAGGTDGASGAGSSSAAAGRHVPTWHGVTASKPAKVLALEAIKALVHHQPIPIARTRMRLRVTVPAPMYKKIKVQVMELFENVQDEKFLGSAEGWECVGFVEPGKYKLLGDLVGQETRGKGAVEVLEMAVCILLLFNGSALELIFFLRMFMRETRQVRRVMVFL